MTSEGKIQRGARHAALAARARQAAQKKSYEAKVTAFLQAHPSLTWCAIVTPVRRGSVACAACGSRQPGTVDTFYEVATGQLFFLGQECSLQIRQNLKSLRTHLMETEFAQRRAAYEEARQALERQWWALEKDLERRMAEIVSYEKVNALVGEEDGEA